MGVGRRWSAVASVVVVGAALAVVGMTNEPPPSPKPTTTSASATATVPTVPVREATSTLSAGFVYPDTVVPIAHGATLFRGNAFTLAPCAFEESAPSLASGGAPSVAAAPDGSVYVLDHEKKLRHYRRTASTKACELVADRSFELDAGRVAGEADVQVDAAGHVYVSSTASSFVVRAGALVPFAPSAVHATLASADVLLGEMRHPQLRTASGATRALAFPALYLDSEAPTARAITVLDHEDILVAGNQSPSFPQEAFAIAHGTQVRRIAQPPKRGIEQNERVDGALRDDEDLIAFSAGRQGGVRLWWQDEKGDALSELASARPRHFEASGHASGGPKGALWVGGEAQRAEAGKAPVVVALFESEVPRGTFHGKPFAPTLSFDDDTREWELKADFVGGSLSMKMPFFPKAGLSSSSDAGALPSVIFTNADEMDHVRATPRRYRLAITKWAVTQRAGRTVGVASGEVFLDLPDQQTRLEGTFDDVAVGELPDSRPGEGDFIRVRHPAAPPTTR